MKQKPSLIVILGPTASGKSSLAVEIALRLNSGQAKKYGINGAEIVSADSRQIYRGMDIGTAKPTKKEMVSVKHHLIDIKNPDEDYAAGQYKKDAIKAINGIIEKGKLPILVGGTGLYISAMVNNLEIPEIKENKKLRKQLEKEIKQKGLGFVFNKLVSIDPEAAYIVDPKNPRRVIRALEIAMVSGKKFSEQRRAGKPLYHVLEIGMDVAPEILKERITKRIVQMMNPPVGKGLLGEVKKLVKKYGYRCRAFDAIGYREIIDYLKNSDFSKFSKNFRKIENPRFTNHALHDVNRERATLGEAVNQMDKNTWRYAKRQITWFRKYNPRTHWIKKENEAIGLVKRFLEN